MRKKAGKNPIHSIKGLAAGNFIPVINLAVPIFNNLEQTVTLGSFLPGFCIGWALVPNQRSNTQYLLTETHEFISHPFFLHDTGLHDVIVEPIISGCKAEDYDKDLSLIIQLSEAAAECTYLVNFPDLTRFIFGDVNDQNIKLIGRAILDLRTKILLYNDCPQAIHRLPKTLYTWVSNLIKPIEGALSKNYRFDSGTDKSVELILRLPVNMWFWGICPTPLAAIQMINNILQDVLDDRDYQLDKKQGERLDKKFDYAFRSHANNEFIKLSVMFSLLHLMINNKHSNIACASLLGRFGINKTYNAFIVKNKPNYPALMRLDLFKYSYRSVSGESWLKYYENTLDYSQAITGFIFRKLSDRITTLLIKLVSSNKNDEETILPLFADILMSEIGLIDDYYIKWKQGKDVPRAIAWYFYHLNLENRQSSRINDRGYWGICFENALTFLETFNREKFTKVIKDMIVEIIDFEELDDWIIQNVALTYKIIESLPEDLLSTWQKSFYWKERDFDRLVSKCDSIVETIE